MDYITTGREDLSEFFLLLFQDLSELLLLFSLPRPLLSNRRFNGFKERNDRATIL